MLPLGVLETIKAIARGCGTPTFVRELEQGDIVEVMNIDEMYAHDKKAA
jgi:hypothetical protein